MSETSPLISIIMPAYNVESYIDQAIDSILRQTYQNWELLICDDASKDKTKEKISEWSKKDSRIVPFYNDQNQKSFVVRNRLFEKAQGEYITFQDADDYSHEERLARYISEFNKNSKLGLLACQVGYISQDGVLLRKSNKPTSYSDVLEKIYESNVIGGAVMIIKRAVLLEVGGYRPYFEQLSYADYDLSFVIAQQFEAYSLPEVLYFYRQHKNSSSKVVDVNRYLAQKVVIHLGKQRRDRGTDDLIEGNPHLVDDYFKKLKLPYIADPSLIFREYAGIFMYNRMYPKAIITAYHAIKKKPMIVGNWRTFQYCLRTYLVRLFFVKSRL